MKEITIIGAGPAGLTAAYELLKSSEECHVTILEQTDRIGGIACTISHNGNYMDLGGHRFYSKSEKVVKWWQDIPELSLMLRKRKSEIYYNKHFFDYPIKINYKNLSALGIGKIFSILFDYIKARIHKREEKSLEDFYINRFGKSLYRLFFMKYTEKVWGISASEISPDWGSQRVKGLSIFEIIKDCMRSALHRKKAENTETSLIDKFYYPPYGPGELWTGVAREIEKMGGEIKFNCCVDSIMTSSGKVSQVSYKCGEAREVKRSDILISSMPLKELIKCIGEAPDKIKTISNGLIYRDFITVGILVRELNLSIDDCWIYMQDKSVRMGRIQIFNNWAETLVKEPEKTVWLGLEYFCSVGDDLWNLSDKELEEFAVGELINAGIIADRASVLDTHTERVEKAYPAYFGTYNKMQELRVYLDGFENIYCVGRNGQHRYNNMDHSMLTAFECVKAITQNITDKTNIWKVNSEKELN